MFGQLPGVHDLTCSFLQAVQGLLYSVAQGYLKHWMVSSFQPQTGPYSCVQKSAVRCSAVQSVSFGVGSGVGVGVIQLTRSNSVSPNNAYLCIRRYEWYFYIKFAYRFSKSLNRSSVAGKT